jgi:hypothetical protein
MPYMKRRSTRLEVEILEDRRLMATCHVVRLGDFGSGGDLGGGHSRGDLRYCITKANSEPGPDIIDISANGTINLTGPLPSLSSDIQIRGPGADLLTIRRGTGGNYRIFTVSAVVSVEISGVTLANGYVVGPNSFTAHGGGILNSGTLLLRSSVLTENRVLAYDGTARGGCLYNSGNLTMIESTIVDNGASGLGAEGGAIYNTGTVSIYSSTIAENIAYEDLGYGYGGAVFSTNVVVVLNSTVHANWGAGIAGGFLIGGGLAIISHSTISGNIGPGLYIDASSSTFMRNTIVSGNSDGDVDGILASSDYNLISNSAGGGGYASTDILDADPLLGALADNGGPTKTMALLPRSPAVDAGDNGDAPEWDQRGPGFPRIVNGRIDIGAFEVQATGAPPASDLTALITADLETIKAKRRK